MPKNAAPVLTMDLSNGAHLEFKTIDELQGWINNEKAFWNWIINLNGHQLGPQFEQLRTRYINAFQQLLSHVNALKQEPTNKDRLQNIHNQFSNIFSPNGQVLLSSHPFAVASNQVNEKSGPLAGATALAFLLKVPFQLPTSAAAEGVMEAILYRDGIDKTSPGIVTKSIQQLNEQQQIQSAQQRSEWTERKNSADTFLEESKSKFSQQIADHEEKWKDISERIAAEFNEAKSSIKATEAAYNEQMKLRASVNYWAGRAKSQHASTKQYLISLVVYAVAAVLFCGALAWEFVPALLAKDISKEPEAYAITLVLALFVITVVFWVARVMVRLYLSAHHLAIDAEERVVMIQTYLALIKEDKLAPDERALVLTPLFRSSADGIVKDEGMPELSTAALVSRLLDKH